LVIVTIYRRLKRDDGTPPIAAILGDTYPVSLSPDSSIK
jgi:hypothetical protein